MADSLPLLPPAIGVSWTGLQADTQIPKKGHNELETLILPLSLSPRVLPAPTEFFQHFVTIPPPCSILHLSTLNLVIHVMNAPSLAMETWTGIQIQRPCPEVRDPTHCAARPQEKRPSPVQWLNPSLGMCEATSGVSVSRLKKNLLSKISIPNNHVVAINPSLPVEEAADKYAERLRELFPGDNIPVFDLVILGIGPDGHTCSLFPDHPLLQEQSKIIAPISDSPKPPPKRITMTLPLLNAARCALFVVTGESKAAVLKDILEGHSENPLPAARVQPVKGEVHWLIDEAAASKLTIKVDRASL